jgi:hypothetical protein
MVKFAHRCVLQGFEVYRLQSGEVEPPLLELEGRISTTRLPRPRLGNGEDFQHWGEAASRQGHSGSGVWLDDGLQQNRVPYFMGLIQSGLPYISTGNSIDEVLSRISDKNASGILAADYIHKAQKKVEEMNVDWTDTSTKGDIAIERAEERLNGYAAGYDDLLDLGTSSAPSQRSFHASTSASAHIPNCSRFSRFPTPVSCFHSIQLCLLN